jgi:hypothetical protein
MLRPWGRPELCRPTIPCDCRMRAGAVGRRSVNSNTQESASSLSADSRQNRAIDRSSAVGDSHRNRDSRWALTDIENSACRALRLTLTAHLPRASRRRCTAASRFNSTTAPYRGFRTVLPPAGKCAKAARPETRLKSRNGHRAGGRAMPLRGTRPQTRATCPAGARPTVAKRGRKSRGPLAWALQLCQSEPDQAWTCRGGTGTPPEQMLPCVFAFATPAPMVGNQWMDR